MDNQRNHQYLNKTEQLVDTAGQHGQEIEHAQADIRQGKDFQQKRQVGTMLLHDIILPKQEIIHSYLQHDSSIEDVDFLDVHQSLVLQVFVNLQLALDKLDGDERTDIDIEKYGSQCQERYQGQHNAMPRTKLDIAEEQNGKHQYG